MTRSAIERLFDALAARDLAGALALFADDAEVIDPHYPVPHMRGRAAIEEGLVWVFGMMASLGFTIDDYFERADGRGAAVAVATSHVLRSGMRLDFAQMFAVEVRDGRITRLRAYTPYGPPGIGGAVLGAVRLWRRVRR